MIIGLTGGIATGKSTVSKILIELGIKVIDSDKIAHEVLNKKEIIEKIKNEFGDIVLNNDLEVNRKKLGKIVFDDKNKLKRLEKITHPEIFKDINHKINEYKKNNEIVVLDAPLLFETNLDGIVDETWVVYSSESTQIKRIKKRDGINKDEALKRIKSQMSIDKKVKKADIVIKNEGSIADLEIKIKKLVEKRT